MTSLKVIYVIVYLSSHSEATVFSFSPGSSLLSILSSPLPSFLSVCYLCFFLRVPLPAWCQEEDYDGEARRTKKASEVLMDSEGFVVVVLIKIGRAHV